MNHFRKRFDYLTFPLESVLSFVGALETDAYFAEQLDGKDKSRWEAALAAGYRWVRTDDKTVILELETEYFYKGDKK